VSGPGSELVSSGTTSKLGSGGSRPGFCGLQSGLVSFWKVLRKTFLLLLAEEPRLDEMKSSGRRDRLLLALELWLALRNFSLLACCMVRRQRRTCRNTLRNC